MATTPVEFRAPTGLTLTLELYAYGSDTIGNTGGDSATEATNRKGLYSANVTEALAGWYTAHVKSGSTVIAVYDVFMVDDTNVHRCTDRPQDQAQETVADVTATVSADVVSISGDATAADNLEAACDGAGYNIGGGSVVAASVTGAVGSVTGAVGSVTGNVGGIAGTITTLDALDTAQDTQHSTTQSAISALNDPTAAAIADAVWLETLADHSGTAGSTAEALNAAGAAGDPWTTALPGAYGAGSAGNIIGNLNDPTAAAIADAVLDEAMAGHVTAGSLGKYIADILEDTGTTIPGTLTTVEGKIDTIDGIVDAIVLDTAELQTDWTNGGRLDLLVDAILEDTGTTLPATLTTIEGKVDAVDTVVDAIPSAATIATTVLTTQMTESYAAAGTAPTLTQALCWLYQDVQEAAVSGTTKTVKKLDQSTTAGTVTLDDASTPTSLTRAT